MKILAGLITLLVRAVTAVRADWGAHAPDLRARVYFANHASHGDFVLIWTVLPRSVRERTRLVVGVDNWLSGWLQRSLGHRLFDTILVEPNIAKRTEDPVQAMARALEAGSSLILFPEGDRNRSELPLLPFKSGLYRLALARPGIEMVPVWVANLNRSVPKGELIPVPFMCTVSFGMPVRLRESEEKTAFLERARAALMSLRPRENSR